MLKPLELPLRVRFWHFIRGLLFYNTVYWKRASDDLKPRSLSREERLSYQPERNLEIIRPRERPRSKIVSAYGGQISLPSAGQTPVPEPVGPEPVPPPVEEIAPVPVAPPPVAVGPEVMVRRRRYRRRSKQVRPSHAGYDSIPQAKAGFFGWLFTRKKRP